jgi:hypothetical protein
MVMRHFLVKELYDCEACHADRDGERRLLRPVGGRLEPAFAERVREALARPVVWTFRGGVRRRWRG